ncbi:hypothetical protein KUTeg_007136 [Tegillarca granosa]|uniref:CLIC N-terminal domain-containing protein n=1 Tax=Tegillarca granosa TaxID=220873 RepID=A0ABQ9FEC1_TEGGR|nr:hypothetical protein KUTeg_007136 [Tegillarca granosa]
MSDDKPFYEPSEQEDNNSVEKSKPCFELYIKASTIDGEAKGSCPICHQWFMIAYLLAERKDASFRVYTVQASMPPKSFTEKTRSKIFPVVIGLSGQDTNSMDISELVCDSYDEVEKFFESINRTCPKLKRQHRDNLLALKVFEDLYKDFKLFLQSKDTEGRKLTNVLRNLNGFLEENDTTFLHSNELSYADCSLLPKLQHIRIAGQAYKGYKIAPEFQNIWRYLKVAYQQNAFSATMPSDQDIVQHYETLVGTPKGRGRPTLEKRSYTMEVDESLLGNVSNEQEVVNDQVNGDDGATANGDGDVVRQSQELEQGQFDNVPDEDDSQTYENVQQDNGDSAE